MKKQIKIIVMIVSTFIILDLGCKKNDHGGSPCDQPATGEYNADVQNAHAMKAGANVPAQWYALAIKLSRVTPNQNIGPIISRAFGYMGVAFYESVVPGLPRYQSIQKQLNGLIH